MMSTAHAKTAQKENPPSHQPIPASVARNPKPPLGPAAGRKTICQHGLFTGLRKGILVGTKPNGNFSKSLQMVYGK
jgi:hypothetical protein